MTATTFAPDEITSYFAHAPQVDPVTDATTTNDREAFLVARVTYQLEDADGHTVRETVRYRVYCIELNHPHGEVDQLGDDFRDQAAAQAAVDEYLRRG